MKKQRPTIPIYEWKVAVHLEASRKIQNQKGTPANGCDCKWCKSWRANYKELLPDDLQEQLLRVGIQLDHPTDLYKFENNEECFSFRVIFHFVGKFISGPNQWKNNEMGKMLMYRNVKKNLCVSNDISSESVL
ncbi:MAG: hypothetical protein AB8D52_03895 [Gammaproteobacteria bacterium]